MCDACCCRESILERPCGDRRGNHSGVSKSSESGGGLEVNIKVCKASSKGTQNREMHGAMKSGKHLL